MRNQLQAAARLAAEMASEMLRTPRWWFEFLRECLAMEVSTGIIRERLREIIGWR